LNPHAATLLLIRFVGLLVVVWRVPELFGGLRMIFQEGIRTWSSGTAFMGRYYLGEIGVLLQVALGLYMLFGGKRLARLILRGLPGVPGLCHRCGYDISGLDSSRCPECGAKIPVRPEPVNSRP
jgi:hypothetical protein